MVFFLSGHVISLFVMKKYEPEQRAMTREIPQNYLALFDLPKNGSYFMTPVFTKHFRYLKWRHILTYISCMDTAYVRENPTPKIAKNKVQETLHFRFLKLLVMCVFKTHKHGDFPTHRKINPVRASHFFSCSDLPAMIRLHGVF